MGDVFLGWLIIASIIGFIPATIAKGKGRDFWTWYAYGVALFFFAMIHAIVLPEKDLKEDPGKDVFILTRDDIRYIDPNCPIDNICYKGYYFLL